MKIRFKRFCYVLAISVVMGLFADMTDNALAQEAEGYLNWEIGTSKKGFYPGEPVLLTLKIKNAGTIAEKVAFGTDGNEAFSIEVRDNSNKAVAEGGKIKGYDHPRIDVLDLLPGVIAEKSIVLNQWCSTLLAPGQYHVACHVEYRLRSEATKIPGTDHGYKSGPLHTIEMKVDINIIKMDTSEFSKMLGQLSEEAFKTKAKTKEDLVNRRIAMEMLAFAESEMAVSYQLQLVKRSGSTWTKRDAINSLACSKTVEAANGLMQIIKDDEEKKKGCATCGGIEDVKDVVIDAIYRLRETGKPEIISITDEFTGKYPRPRLGKIMD